MRRALHNSDDPSAHVSRSLAVTDPPVGEALDNETRRQRVQIELIASENVMSRAVREALGHEIGNKTLEGYPGNRFHGGGEYVDVVERLAIERAKELFGAAYANVQPHSGTQANQAVIFMLLQPGDRILSLDLAAGGHLSHGAGANLSGRWFEPPRLSRRPHLVRRGSCYGKTFDTLSGGGSGTGCSAGFRASGRAWLAMGGDVFDRGEVRLHDRDAAAVGPSG